MQHALLNTMRGMLKLLILIKSEMKLLNPKGNILKID